MRTISTSLFSYLLLGLFILGSYGLKAQSDNMAFRHPSLSPDGKTIAFGFQGDIWTVDASGGIARRLTVHEGYESHPTWSADGQKIAFTSDRYGNRDIFTMPAIGGKPQRLTHHSGNESLSDWTGDNRLLFNTNRVYTQIEWESEMYQIDASGGTEYRLTDALGTMPNLSPDRQLLAFVKGHCRTAREDYQGPAGREVWVQNVETGDFHQITDFEGNDFMPLWGDERTLYFISSQSGRYNIYRQALTQEGKPDGEATQITDFDKYGVNQFSIGSKRQTIAYEKFGEIFTMPISGGKAKKLSINVANDYRFDPKEHKTYSGSMREYAISPSGKLVAFGVRGEVFVKLNDKERSRSVNVSKHPYRDHDVVWGNDSTLLFVSDRAGQRDIYLVRSADPEESSLFKSLKHETVRLTSSDEPEYAPIISPDKKRIAFRRGSNYGPSTFVVAEIDAANAKIKKEKVLSEGWATISSPTWSPDSRWLAYSLKNLNFNSDIYIHEVDSDREPSNISMHPRGDYSPVWSKDGSKLAFVSERNNGFDIWFAWLKKSDWEKTRQDWKEMDDEEEEEDKDKKKDEEDGVPPMEIDLEDIHFRLEQVTSFPGNESNPVISADGEHFFFTAQPNSERSGRDMYKVKWDGSDLQQLTKGPANPSGLSLGPKDKYIYSVKSGRLNRTAVASGKTKGLSHSAMMVINHTQEQEQVFEEAWEALNLGFYDPDFHGNDWKALRKKFKPVCLAAATKTDFRYYFNLMAGQLNASHMGLYGSDRQETQRERTGLLGLEVAPSSDGVRVKKVVKDSPADKEESTLQVGDVITHINEEPIAKKNFYQFLTNAATHRILLDIKRDGKEMEITIRPTSSLRSELYDEWVAEQRAMVDKYSDGQLGYIHIQGMNMPSFERFERELTAAGLGKKGLVIDVRYNGGGWTTDYLMAVLNVKQHAYTIPRGAAKSLEEHEQFKDYYPFGERLPFGTWTKPSVALCNEASYSNAEIFSHAYKTLGIGKLVGRPTFGAVISTGGQSLIDGSYVRMPFRAWYVKKTRENMENGPAVPNIDVKNPVGQKATGEDDQLKKAVEVLMEEL